MSAPSFEKDPLHVAIIGPGALGRSVGGVLERGGARVSYIGRGGKVVAGAPLDESEAGKPTWLDEDRGHGRPLAIVTTKAYDTDLASSEARGILSSGSVSVVTLQNGLGNIEELEGRCDPYFLYAGATTHAARRLPSGDVETVALGETSIAPVPSMSTTGYEDARELAARLSAYGLPTRAEDDSERLIWRKVAVSCGINGVTALERCANGALLERPAALSRAIAAAREALEVARDLRIRVDPAEAEALIRSVALRTAKNRSSMLQDLEAKRPTEVDEIHGEVVQRAREELHRDAPVNRAILDEVNAIELCYLHIYPPREILTPHGR